MYLLKILVAIFSSISTLTDICKVNVVCEYVTGSTKRGLMAFPNSTDHNF